MAEAALFYPRMHLDKPEWLKGALLVFDQVQRMVPPGLHLADSREIEPFTLPHGNGRRLLEPANIVSPRVRKAIQGLVGRIERDARSAVFRRAFGEEATRRAMAPGDYGYQIHVGKFGGELVHVLDKAKLSWKPHRAEPYEYWEGYIEVHPQMGEAIMSTLAIACARAEDLKIITDDDSEPLHDCLIGLDGKRVYDAWIHGDPEFEEPRKPDGQELLECLVTIACDVSELDAQTLADMRDDREPLRRLLARLEEKAKPIGPMDRGKARAQRLRDEVADILREWEGDRANMSDFFARFFGLGLLDPSAKFADKIVTGMNNAAAAGGAGIASATVLGAGYGLGIGLVTHAVKSAAETVTAKRSSPYALLSTMKREGVVFRSSTEVRGRRV